MLIFLIIIFEMSKEQEPAKQTEMAAKQNATEGSKVVNMKPGDYVVHIHIQVGKDFELDDEEVCDPQIYLSVGDQLGKSTVKKDIAQDTTVKFDEHVFLQLNQQSLDELKSATVKIKAMNSGFFKNDLIGQFEIPLAKIYSMENHLLLNQYVSLSTVDAEYGQEDDAKNDGSKVTAVIGVSVNVTGPGDEAQELKQATEEQLNEKPPLLPTAITKEYKQVIFKILKAEDLPNMDDSVFDVFENLFDNNQNPKVENKTDAYAIIKYGKISMRTEIANATLEKSKEFVFEEKSKQAQEKTVMKYVFTWAQNFQVPIQIPVQHEYFLIEIYDHDLIQDELIASLKLPIEDLVMDEHDPDQYKCKWLNLYSGPRDAKYSSISKWMTQNPEKASCWAGRMLVQIGCKDVEHPKVQQTNIEKKDYDRILNEVSSRREDYMVMVQIPSAISLPGTKKYKIRIKIGHSEWTSNDPIQIEKEYARWNYQEKIQIKNTAATLSALPDMFIQLIDPDSEQPICYFRSSLAEFNYEASEKLGLDDPHPENSPLNWIPFEVDQSYGQVSDLYRAGFFGLRIYAQKGEISGFDTKKLPNWNKKMPRRNEAHKLRVAIYQCMNLPAADEEGTSDPYVQAWTPHSDQKNSTTVVYDDNNPIYYEALEYNIEFSSVNGLDEAPPIMLEVFDKDTGIMDSKDDFLGRAMIFLHDLPQEKPDNDPLGHKTYLCREDAIVVPAMYPIKFKTDDPWDESNGATILCSFTLLPFDIKPLVPIEKLKLDKLIPIENKNNLRSSFFNMPDLAFQEFQVEIVALGVRQLKPEGVLPINKPFVKFKVNSLVRADQSRAIKDITTEPNETGPNANLNSTMEFKVELPSDHLYCPRMTCEVFDQLYFAAFGQPQIGSFTLNVGDERHELVKRDENYIQQLKNTNELLIQLKDAIEKDRQGQSDQNEWSRVNALCQKITENINQQGLYILGQSGNQETLISSKNVFKVNVDKGVKKQKKKKKVLKKKAKQHFDVLVKKETVTENRGNPFKMQPKIQDEGIEDSDGSQLQLDDIGDGMTFEVKDVAQTSQVKQNFKQFSKDVDNLTQEQAKKKFKKISRKYREAERLKEREQLKQQTEQARTSAQQAMSQQKDAHNNIIYPKYMYDKRLGVDREVDPPSDKIFFPIGFSRNPNDKKMQYRRFHPDELETHKDLNGHLIIDSPFKNEEIFRATAKKTNTQAVEDAITGFFGGQVAVDDLGPDMVMKTVGRFKYILNVYEKTAKHHRDAQKMKQVVRIQQAIEVIYNLEMNHRKWKGEKSKFPAKIWDGLNPEKGSTFEKAKDVLRQVSDLVNDAGLGSLDLESSIAKVYAEKLLDYYLKKKIKCRARLYVLTGFNLAKRDVLTQSDPYIIVRCGQQEYSKRDDYVVNSSSPDFYHSFEFLNDYPGSPALEIEVYDYDEFFGDDEIGTTQIDLDDRYFSLGWQSIDNKPIEYRDLYTQTSNQSQGQIKLWVEIDEQQSKFFKRPMVDITPEPNYEVEVRVVIWGTRYLEEMDWEGCTDAYFRAYLNSDDDQTTDTHWRCQTGDANFNWRCLFTTNQKQKDLTLTVQGWDRDIITSDELIGTFELPIGRMVEDCFLTERQFNLTKAYFQNEVEDGQNFRQWLRSYNKPEDDARDDLKKDYDWDQGLYDKIEYDPDEVEDTGKTNPDAKKKGTSAQDMGEQFWVPIYRTIVKEDKTEERKHGGDVKITVHVLPKTKADKQPLGKGRDDLNTDPFCPPPAGRMEFSLNPFTMLAQLIPEKFRREICYYCCLIICAALCIYMAPMIISNGISKLIFG